MSHTDKTQPAARTARRYPTHTAHGKRPFLRKKEREHTKRVRGHAKQALGKAPRHPDLESFDIPPVRESARGSAAYQL